MPNHVTNKCCFKGKPKCSKCGKFSHITERCWGGKQPDNKISDIKMDHTNIAHDPKGDKQVASTSYVTQSDNNKFFTFYPWIPDSATTSHITHTKAAFLDYTPIKPIPVKGLGNI